MVERSVVGNRFEAWSRAARVSGWGVLALLPLALALAASPAAADEAPRCPEGATLVGAPPPDGLEEWCEIANPDGETVKHGRYVSWFDPTHKQAEIEYVDGREHGRATAWYPTGQKAAEGVYENGERTGLWTRWYGDGVKQAETHFSAGIRHGIERQYDEQGKLIVEVEWEHGEPKNARDGKPSSGEKRKGFDAA